MDACYNKASGQWDDRKLYRAFGRYAAQAQQDAVNAALEKAAMAGYVVCASTRHVSLGHKVSDAILAGLEQKERNGTIALPDDVRALVIAARKLWDGYGLSGDALDKALEAFASRVPFANEPD